MRVHERGRRHHRGVRHRRLRRGAGAARVGDSPAIASSCTCRGRRRGRRSTASGVTLAGRPVHIAEIEVPARELLIERGIRERIVLVGVTLPPATDRRHRGAPRRARAARRHRGRRRGRRASLQRRDRPDPATYVGKGKAEELRESLPRGRRRHVVFDDELIAGAAAQPREDARPHRVDRTAVILDIFAQNARTQEGKAQVELAQLRYRLPRLRGAARAAGLSASRRVGIGTRGPGETQLEVDRRRLLRRITKLEPTSSDLGKTRAHRSARRAHRAGSARSRSSATRTPASRRCSTGSPTPACSSRTACSPRSTRRTRRLDLPGGETVLLSDTVGFVRKLPHQLVEAFQSTLEVVGDADLLVHVVDASPPIPTAQIDAVRAVLARDRRRPTCPSCSCSTRPTSPTDGQAPRRRHPGSVAISALTGEGSIDLLLDDRRPAAGACRRSSSSSSRTTAATCSPRCTARRGRSSSARRRRHVRRAGPPRCRRVGRRSPSSRRSDSRAT